MNTEIKINHPSEDLPQPRVITGFDNIPKITLPQKRIPQIRKIKLGQIKEYFTLPNITRAILVMILIVTLLRIYDYRKENMNLYSLSQAQTLKISALDQELRELNKFMDKLIARGRDLSFSYRNLGFNFARARKRFNSFKNISLSKSAKIDFLEGELRVVKARFESAAAQNTVLTKDLNDYREYIRELTNKIIAYLEVQQQLITENIELKGGLRK